MYLKILIYIIPGKMGKQMMILVYLNTTISRNIELIKLKYMRKTNKCYEAGHHVSIATKISPEYVDKLKFVAKSFDMSPYELLQCLLYSFLRYFDSSSGMTHEHSSMLFVFTNTLLSLKNSHNPLSIKNIKEEKINKGIFFIETPGGQPQLLSVSMDKYGNLEESFNIEKIISDVLNIEDPKLLQVLEDERERMGFFSICQTLHHLVIQASTPPSDKVAEEVSSLFKDNNRAENYKPLEYGERTVAKQHHTPDSITQHPRYNRDTLLPKT